MSARLFPVTGLLMGCAFALLALVAGPGPQRIVWLIFAGMVCLIGLTSCCLLRVPRPRFRKR